METAHGGNVGQKNRAEVVVSDTDRWNRKVKVVRDERDDLTQDGYQSSWENTRVRMAYSAAPVCFL